jgi:hypothetical protein
LAASDTPHPRPLSPKQIGVGDRIAMRQGQPGKLHWGTVVRHERAVDEFGVERSRFWCKDWDDAPPEHESFLWFNHIVNWDCKASPCICGRDYVPTDDYCCAQCKAEQ